LCHIREHLHQINFILDPTDELTTLGKFLKITTRFFDIFVKKSSEFLRQKNFPGKFFCRGILAYNLNFIFAYEQWNDLVQETDLILSFGCSEDD
jgi:hypothetical protein